MTRSIPAYAQPAFVEFVSTRAAKGDEDAARLLARLPRRSGLPKGKAPGKTKAGRREERADRIAKIRAEVFARAGGKCELGRHLAATVIHHVVGGGLRRHRESVETCVALCAPCHHNLHDGKEYTLRDAYEWAIRGGFREAARALEHRLAKIEEARRTA